MIARELPHRLKTENLILDIPTRMPVPGFYWLPKHKETEKAKSSVYVVHLSYQKQQAESATAASHWVGVAEEESSNQSVIGGCS